MKPRTCEICKKPSAAFLCDDPACRESHNARCREYQRRKRAESASRGESYRNRWTNGRKRKSNISCVGCGGPIQSGSTAGTRCRACHHPRVSRTRKAQRKLDRAARGSRGKGTWVGGECARCGTLFVARLVTGSATRHCSKACVLADRRAVHRARKAGVKVTPGRRSAVYTRDNWICQICGDPVNPTVKVPSRDAPVIDHIVPLARGGAHAPENWQTAHFWCNSWKRDQEDFSFMEVLA